MIRYTSPVEGTWKIARAGALKVGPAPNSDQWWSNSLTDVTTRACYFDDNYVFNSDGSFQNVLGSETWLEGWQTGTDDARSSHSHDGVALHHILMMKIQDNLLIRNRAYGDCKSG